MEDLSPTTFPPCRVAYHVRVIRVFSGFWKMTKRACSPPLQTALNWSLSYVSRCARPGLAIIWDGPTICSIIYLLTGRAGNGRVFAHRRISEARFGHGDGIGRRNAHCDEEIQHLRQILDSNLIMGPTCTDPGVQRAVCRQAGFVQTRPSCIKLAASLGFGNEALGNGNG